MQVFGRLRVHDERVLRFAAEVAFVSLCDTGEGFKFGSAEGAGDDAPFIGARCGGQVASRPEALDLETDEGGEFISAATSGNGAAQVADMHVVNPDRGEPRVIP